MEDNNNLTNKILTKMSAIFGSTPTLDPVTFEVKYQGTKEQLRRSVTELEIHEIDYSVEWKHTLGDSKSKPYIVSIKIILKLRQ